jgi:hypothetical protein
LLLFSLSAPNLPTYVSLPSSFPYLRLLLLFISLLIIFFFLGVFVRKFLYKGYESVIINQRNSKYTKINLHFLSQRINRRCYKQYNSCNIRLMSPALHGLPNIKNYLYAQSPEMCSNTPCMSQCLNCLSVKLSPTACVV